MENLVVTLETAQKLKAAGFGQTTWYKWHVYKYEGSRHRMPAFVKLETSSEAALSPCINAHVTGQFEMVHFAAPTAQEIADQIMQLRSTGKIAPYTLEMGSNGVGYQCTWGELRTLHFNTMAEALAALWLKLQEAK